MRMQQNIRCQGKEVSAEQIADSKNADGSTATNYYVNEKGAVANAIRLQQQMLKQKHDRLT